MKSAGRPRSPSSRSLASPLSDFLDANWDRLGLTNEAAAAQFSLLSPNMISHWRTGRTPVALSHLPKLAQMLGADEAMLFVLWLKQQRLRDASIPADFVELLERRLMTANEAVLVKAVRNATKNADPTWSANKVTAVASAVAP